jgi:hypothetical protein
MSDSRFLFRLASLAPLFVFVTACATGNTVQRPVEYQRMSPAEPATGHEAAGLRESPASPRTEPAEAGGNGARGAKSDEPAKTDEPATRDDELQPFPAADVRTALRAALPGLHSCSDGGTHSFDTALRFEPSGKVSKVTVTPPDGPVAKCVRHRLSEIAVTPFKGEAVTVRTPVEL